MARKKTRKRMKKTQKRMKKAGDTELTSSLVAADGTGAGQGIVSIPHTLSKMNMRLYRQGMSYPVSFRTVNQGTGGSTFSYRFYTLANNWFTLGAIRFAFKNWRASLQEELTAGAKVGRWIDFRVDSTNPDGDNTVLNPVSWDGDGYNALDAGEYTSSSTTTVADGSEDGFNLFGALSSHYNIFSEYAKYLDSGKPDDSSTTTANVYSGMIEGDDNLTRESLTEDYDTPPYPQDLGGTNWADAVMVLQDVITFDGGSGPSSLSTRTFDAPLGFVYVMKTDDGSDADFSTSVPELLMRVKPGSYKGTDAKAIIKWPRDLRLATARSNR